MDTCIWCAAARRRPPPPSSPPCWAARKLDLGGPAPSSRARRADTAAARTLGPSRGASESRRDIGSDLQRRSTALYATSSRDSASSSSPPRRPDREGHVNCSPKGLDALRVLGPTTVAYLDYVGSGAETIAHLRENGRIVLMFCAFEGPPKIVRLHGRGEVARAWRRRLRVAARALRPRARACARSSASRSIASPTPAATACRGCASRASATQLPAWAERKGEDGLLDVPADQERREHRRAAGAALGAATARVEHPESTLNDVGRRASEADAAASPFDYASPRYDGAYPPARRHTVLPARESSRRAPQARARAASPDRPAPRGRPSSATGKARPSGSPAPSGRTSRSAGKRREMVSVESLRFGNETKRAFDQSKYSVVIVSSPEVALLVLASELRDRLQLSGHPSNPSSPLDSCRVRRRL